MSNPIDPERLESALYAMRDAMVDLQTQNNDLRTRLLLLELTSHAFFKDNAYNDWFYSSSGAVAAYNMLHAHEDAFRPAQVIEDVPRWFREPKQAPPPATPKTPPKRTRIDDLYKDEI